MRTEDANIGQRVYCLDDGTEFVIIDFDEAGATVKNENETTWIEFWNLAIIK